MKRKTVLFLWILFVLAVAGATLLLSNYLAAFKPAFVDPGTTEPISSIPARLTASFLEHPSVSRSTITDSCIQVQVLDYAGSPLVGAYLSYHELLRGAETKIIKAGRTDSSGLALIPHPGARASLVAWADGHAMTSLPFPGPGSKTTIKLNAAKLGKIRIVSARTGDSWKHPARIWALALGRCRPDAGMMVLEDPYALGRQYELPDGKTFPITLDGSDSIGLLVAPEKGVWTAKVIRVEAFQMEPVDVMVDDAEHLEAAVTTLNPLTARSYPVDLYVYSRDLPFEFKFQLFHAFPREERGSWHRVAALFTSDGGTIVLPWQFPARMALHVAGSVSSFPSKVLLPHSNSPTIDIPFDPGSSLEVICVGFPCPLSRLQFRLAKIAGLGNSFYLPSNRSCPDRVSFSGIPFGQYRVEVELQDQGESEFRVPVEPEVAVISGSAQDYRHKLFYRGPPFGIVSGRIQSDPPACLDGRLVLQGPGRKFGIKVESNGDLVPTPVAAGRYRAIWFGWNSVSRVSDRLQVLCSGSSVSGTIRLGTYLVKCRTSDFKEPIGVQGLLHVLDESGEALDSYPIDCNHGMIPFHGDPRFVYTLSLRGRQLGALAEFIVQPMGKLSLVREVTLPWEAHL